MSELQIRAVIAGVAFGVWPLLMNKSGLSGYLSAMMFAIFALLTITPFAIYGGFQGLRTSMPAFFIGAGVVAGLGVVSFNGALAKANKTQVGPLILTMIVAQICIPAIYDMYQSQNYEPKKIVGILLSFAVGFLLK